MTEAFDGNDETSNLMIALSTSLPFTPTVIVKQLPLSIVSDCRSSVVSETPEYEASGKALYWNCAVCAVGPEGAAGPAFFLHADIKT